MVMIGLPVMSDFSRGTRWVQVRWPLTDFAARLEASRLELLRQILDGLGLARRRRPAAFEIVVGQDTDVLLQPGLVEGRLLSDGCCRQHHRCGKEKRFTDHASTPWGWMS